MSVPGYGEISREAPSAAGAECPAGNLDQLRKYLWWMMSAYFQRLSTSTGLSLWALRDTASPVDEHPPPPGGRINPTAGFRRNSGPDNRDVSIHQQDEVRCAFPPLIAKTYRKHNVCPSVGQKTTNFPGRQVPCQGSARLSNLQGFRRTPWESYWYSQLGRTQGLNCFHFGWSRRTMITSPY